MPQATIELQLTTRSGTRFESLGEERFDLVEGLHRRGYLRANCLLAPDQSRLWLKLLGGHIKLTYRDNTLYEGSISAAARRGPTVRVGSRPDFARDRSRAGQETSFLSPSAQPTPIHELRGFKQAYAAVAGLELLSARVTSLTKLGHCCEFDLLWRAAALSGMVLKSVAGRLEICAPTPSATLAWPRDVVCSPQREWARIPSPHARCIAIDQQGGELFDSGEQSPQADLPIARELLEASQCAGAPLSSLDWLHEADRAVCQSTARQLAQAGLSRAYGCEIVVSDASMAPLQQYAVPTGLGETCNLVVGDRRVRFDPRKRVQLRNRLSFVAAVAASLPPKSRRPGAAVRPGIVCETLDPTGRKCVRVWFPWMSGGGSGAQREGMWCATDCKFAGLQPTPHYAGVGPLVGDWVEAVFSGAPEALPYVRRAVPVGSGLSATDTDKYITLYDSPPLRVVIERTTGKVWWINTDDGRKATLCVRDGGVDFEGDLRFV
ncbi:MAG TPA: hypothetical protein VHC22_24115 [Pirellulales bacterium]|nr:hypothetical protein [Pirellulales bacterium]